MLVVGGGAVGEWGLIRARVQIQSCCSLGEGKLDVPTTGFFSSKETMNVYLFSDTFLWCTQKEQFKGEIVSVPSAAVTLH